jgi:hypothetical protein
MDPTTHASTIPAAASHRRVTTLLLLALLATSLAIPAHADETNRCYGVQGEATTAFDPTVGGFVGVATVRLGGQEQQATATAYVTGPGSTSHVLEFSQGTLVTHDELILRPIDPGAGTFELRSRLTVVDGGSGKLHLLPGSTLDLAAGVAEWRLRGSVCFD